MSSCGTSWRSRCGGCGTPPGAGPAVAIAPGPPSLAGVAARCGPASAPAFFFEIAPRQGDEQMSHRQQTHVMVPADPRPRLVLRHPQVTLGVLEILLDLVPGAGHTRQDLQGRQGVGVADVVLDLG